MELIDFSSSVWSIVPALLAIILAIATRRVLVSLSAGIIIGSLMLSDWQIGSAFNYLVKMWFLWFMPMAKSIQI